MIGIRPERAIRHPRETRLLQRSKSRHGRRGPSWSPESVIPAKAGIQNSYESPLACVLASKPKGTLYVSGISPTVSLLSHARVGVRHCAPAREKWTMTHAAQEG